MSISQVPKWMLLRFLLIFELFLDIFLWMWILKIPISKRKNDEPQLDEND